MFADASDSEARGVKLLEAERFSEALSAFEKSSSGFGALHLKYSRDATVAYRFASALNNTSATLNALGRKREAREKCLIAIPIFAQVWEQHPDRPEFGNDLASAIQNLALLLSQSDKPDSAEPIFLESLRVRDDVLQRFPKLSYAQVRRRETVQHLDTLREWLNEHPRPLGAKEPDDQHTNPFDAQLDTAHRYLRAGRFPEVLALLIALRTSISNTITTGTTHQKILGHYYIARAYQLSACAYVEVGDNPKSLEMMELVPKHFEEAAAVSGGDTKARMIEEAKIAKQRLEDLRNFDPRYLEIRRDLSRMDGRAQRMSLLIGRYILQGTTTGTDEFPNLVLNAAMAAFRADSAAGDIDQDEFAGFLQQHGEVATEMAMRIGRAFGFHPRMFVSWASDAG